MLRQLPFAFLVLAVPAFAAPPPPVSALAYHPNGKLLAAGLHGEVVIVDSPNGELLASASADRTVKMWDAATGKRLYTLGDPTDWVYALAWHPDGKHIAAAGVDKSIRVWEVNADAGKLVQSVFGHTQPVTK